MMTTVTDDDFKNSVDSFIDESLKEPVRITRHGKRVITLINTVELERLISAADNRQSYFINELPQEAIEALEQGPQAPARPELDHLMCDKRYLT